MPGPNTTGKPLTTDYNLGRGVIYFASLDTNGRPKAWRDLGNAPEFNVSLSNETLQHRSSREGLKTIDLEVVISQDAKVAFKLDEANNENLSAFFAGAEATHTNVAVAGFTEWEMVPAGAGSLAKVRWYDIKNSAHNRAYDVDHTKLTVKTTNVSPVTLTYGTDYEVDEEMGRIFILGTAAVNTAIAGNEGLDVTLTADAGAHGVDEVRGLTTTTVRGALKFIGVNPANADSKIEYEFHKVSLKAEGDFSLIGDEISAMGFTAAAEKSEAAYAASPTLTIRVVKAA